MKTKKQYMKPTMKIVQIQHHQILCGSPTEPAPWGSPNPDNPYDFD